MIMLFYVIEVDGEEIASTGYNTLSYTLRGITAGGEYKVSVYAKGFDGSLSAPAELTVSVSGGGLTQYQAADVNCDGKVDATDATLILQFYAGIIPNFPKAE